MKDNRVALSGRRGSGQGGTDQRRRSLLAGLVLLPFGSVAAFAEEVVDLQWIDLLPEGENPIPNALLGIIDHGQSQMQSQQPDSTGLRTDWNGQTVRLPGYIVPIDYSGTGVTAFILVPFVGACVHVPPPPANQLVFVTTETPYESDGLFEAVSVTGMFGTAATQTQLAKIGYALSAEKIEPYSG